MAIVYFTDVESYVGVVDAFKTVQTIANFGGTGSIGNQFKTILVSLMLFSLFGAAIVSMTKFTLVPMTQHIFYGLLVWVGLFVPQVEITIKSNTSAETIRTPLGLGVTALAVNSVGRFLTDAYITSTSAGGGNLSNFKRMGYFSGPNIHNSITNDYKLDPKVRDFMAAIGRSCIQPELISNNGDRIKKLITAPNIYDYISDNIINIGRTVSFDGITMSCDNAWKNIGGIKTTTENIIKNYASLKSEANNPNKNTLLGAGMMDFYQKITGGERNAKDIDKSGFYNNVIASIPELIGTAGGTGANELSTQVSQAIFANYFINQFSKDMDLKTNTLDFGTALSESQVATTNAFSAASFVKFAPKLKAITEAIIIIIFPLIILMTVIKGADFMAPFGIYIRIFMWVSLWQPFYAIITHMMTMNWYTPAMVSMGATNLTISNIGDLVSFNRDINNQAGALLWSIIPLSWALLKSGDAAVSGLFSSLGGSIKGTAEKVGSELGSGNFNVGNATWGNQNYGNSTFMNTKGNSSSTNFETAAGRVTSTNASGGTLSANALNTQLGHQGAHLNVPVSTLGGVNATKGNSTKVSSTTSSIDNASSTQGLMKSASNQLASALDKITGNTLGNSTSSALSATALAQNAVKRAAENGAQFGSDTSRTVQDVVAFFAALQASVGGGGKSGGGSGVKGGIPGAIMSFFGFDVSASAGAEMKTSETDATAAKASNGKSYSVGADQSAANTNAATDTFLKNIGLNNSQAATIKSLLSSNTDYQDALSKAISYQKLDSKGTESVVGKDQNLNNQFVNGQSLSNLATYGPQHANKFSEGVNPIVKENEPSGNEGRNSGLVKETNNAANTVKAEIAAAPGNIKGDYAKNSQQIAPNGISEPSGKVSNQPATIDGKTPDQFINNTQKDVTTGSRNVLNAVDMNPVIKNPQPEPLPKPMEWRSPEGNPGGETVAPPAAPPMTLPTGSIRGGQAPQQSGRLGNGGNSGSPGSHGKGVVPRSNSPRPPTTTAPTAPRPTAPPPAQKPAQKPSRAGFYASEPVDPKKAPKYENFSPDSEVRLAPRLPGIN